MAEITLGYEPEKMGCNGTGRQGSTHSMPFSREEIRVILSITTPCHPAWEDKDSQPERHAFIAYYRVRQLNNSKQIPTLRQACDDQEKTSYQETYSGVDRQCQVSVFSCQFATNWDAGHCPERLG